jgi:hypothetical protein
MLDIQINNFYNAIFCENFVKDLQTYELRIHGSC